MASTTEEAAIIRLARKGGVVRPRDLAAKGLSRTALSRLVDAGKMERVSRGIYRLIDRPIGDHASLAEACKRVPDGVVCLLSALSFHDLTTQAPHEVWLAINRKAWKPKPGNPPVRIFRFSGAALVEGVESRKIDGVQVRVYSAAKTVADCFKYRNKIGIDVAVEALHDYRRKRKGTIEKLWRFAEVCRVTKVIRPYVEAMQ